MMRDETFPSGMYSALFFYLFNALCAVRSALIKLSNPKKV